MNVEMLSWCPKGALAPVFISFMWEGTLQANKKKPRHQFSHRISDLQYVLPTKCSGGTELVVSDQILV